MARVSTMLAGLALAAAAVTGSANAGRFADFDSAPPATHSDDEADDPPCSGAKKPDELNKPIRDHSGEAVPSGIPMQPRR